MVRGVAQAGAKAGLLLWGNPFAASVIGYLVSSAAVTGSDRLRGGTRGKASRSGLLWFVLTGLINGSAMLLMYTALAIAPVSTVAPVIAAYPLVTALATALFLRGEILNARIIAGAVITVAAIAWLAAARPDRLRPIYSGHALDTLLLHRDPPCAADPRRRNHFQRRQLDAADARLPARQASL